MLYVNWWRIFRLREMRFCFSDIASAANKGGTTL